MRASSNLTALTIAAISLIALPTLLSAATDGVENRVNLRRMAEGPPGSVRGANDFYIVEFVEAPLIRYEGGVDGLAATSPRVLGQSRLNSGSPASLAYLQYLEGSQNARIALIEGRLGRGLEVLYRYRAGVNGIAARMSQQEVALVATLPGVKSIVPDRLYPLLTDRGPTWIGAPDIWDGTATNGLPGTKGEGVVIADLDSGLNMDHPSFAEVGGDGYAHINPLGEDTYLGWCDPTNPNFSPAWLCNDKWIGAWDYMDAYCAANPGDCSEADGPGDDNGHGSHTASTAAGNVLLSPAISGVAPHANLINYDVCFTNSVGQGLCPFTATSAAVDQMILDSGAGGVEGIPGPLVIAASNYSIGGGNSPWGGDIDSFFLAAFDVGIYPAASAGNDGIGTVSHLGPWMSTMGASTHDRVTVENMLIDMTGGISPPGDLTGASRTEGYGPATVVHAGDSGDAQCLTPFAGGTWTSGEIVMCDRGTIARILKCANVAAGGAAGCILGNTPAGATGVVADPHVIPAIHLDTAEAAAVRTWLTRGVGHTATITASTIIVDPAVADIMADFSSTGPNLDFSVIKPDLTAPGVTIFAAVSDDPVNGLENPFANFSGTSMSSPHNAGSAALLADLRPDWSPAEIKSAIMLTSDTTVLKPDGSTPADITDMGAGRIDLSKAGESMIVMDESYEDFLAADPAQGGRPETLNLASLQENSCVGDCSWVRFFRSGEPPLFGSSAGASLLPSGKGVHWIVTFDDPPGGTMSADPSEFGLLPGVSGPEPAITVEVEFTWTPVPPEGGSPTGPEGDPFLFGQVILSPDDGSPVLHMPVALRAGSVKIPEFIRFMTTLHEGAGAIEGIEFASAIPDTTLTLSGLTKLDLTEVLLDEDPTNGDPFDNLADVFVKTVAVAPGAKSLVVATSSEESPDVDLFVGTGATPSAATQICASTSATATERCDVPEPSTGTWWIVVQNWQGSASQPDLILLRDAVLAAGAAGNMQVDAPASVPPGAPFDISVDWLLPTISGGDIWIASLDVGSSAGTPDNIGTIAIEVAVPDSVIFVDGFESGDTTAW